MAVSPFVTPDVLNEWQLHMEADGRGKWWFNQATGTDAEISEGARVYLQFERNLIAQSLASARQDVENVLHTSIAPTYMTETLNVDQVSEILQNQYLKLKYGNVIAFGTRATTLLEADASIVYSNEYLPTIDDTATITLTDSETDPDEIQVFFRTADGADNDGDANWRIYPLNVVRTNSTTITITGHRSLFVKPSIWKVAYENVSALTREFANTTVSADFVTEVDIYRVYTDTDNAVTVKASPYNLSSATSITAEAQPRLVDAEQGVFQARFPAVNIAYNTDTVEVNYLCGYPLVNQRIDTRLMQPVARLANTYMPEQIAPIYDVTFGRYAYDREPTPGSELQPAMVNNPFGIKRGQIYAWNRAKALAIGTRISAV